MGAAALGDFTESFLEHPMQIADVESSLTRRNILAAAAASSALLALPSCAEAQPAEVAALAENAAIWGFPLVLIGRYLKLSQDAGIGYNRFHLNQDLATPTLHVPGPNVDTIYGLAWLDLSAEPLVISVPDADDRYYSIHLLDAYANTFAYIGRRETGTEAGAFVISAPDWQGELPPGARQIAAPTSLVLAITRTLVKGQSDLRAAQELQARYAIGPLSAYPNGQATGVVSRDVLNVLPQIDLASAGATYFDELNELVRRYPPTGPEAQRLTAFDSFGLGAEDPGYKTLLSETERASALDRALARINAFNASEEINGWRVNFHIEKFIPDPLARAAANQFGPGAHIAEEALYFSARTDSAGAALTGAAPVRVRFPPGQTPPVDAFWSLILYDQNFFLFDNPLNRYTINDRTENLVYDGDGSLTVHIAASPPQDRVNWLPAPAGAYQLILRTYQPRAAILDRSYRPPPLAPIA